MKKYEYLLFDADNTLLDFTMAENLAFRATCEKCGMICTDELYRAYSKINESLWKKLEVGGITLDALKLERFRQLLAVYDGEERADTLARAVEMRDNYINLLALQGCLVPGAEEICAALSEKYEMYIITNGIAEIQHSRLSRTPLLRYFKRVFISEEIGHAKPAPEYFDFVLDEIGDHDKSKYLVIGDSLSSDCDGAIGYGLDICRFNPNKSPDNGRELTYTVSELSELMEIL